MTRSKTGWLFLGTVFILALAGVTSAVYAHGGGPTLIHACVNRSSGEVKIVGANASCKNNETALDWPASPGPAVGVAKVLTEISLVSTLTNFAAGFSGEASHFLWEPDRYDPAPTEMFLEVDASNISGTVTFHLQDLTNNMTIVGSSITTRTGGRLRSGNIATSFPTTSAEIALVVDSGGGEWSIQRSAVLIQQ